MRDHKAWCWSALLLIGATACAHVPSETLPETGTYVAPKLIACSGYVAPARPRLVRATSVSVQMKVLPDGAVDPASVRVLTYRTPSGAAARAMSLAQGCSFEPAYQGEETVQGRAVVRFHLR